MDASKVFFDMITEYAGPLLNAAGYHITSAGFLEDANGNKIGHSSPSFLGGMNHYDNNGHKVGESRPGFFGSMKHYDNKGNKQGHSEPGLFGGYNHYDE